MQRAQLTRRFKDKMGENIFFCLIACQKNVCTPKVIDKSIWFFPAGCQGYQSQAREEICLGIDLEIAPCCFSSSVLPIPQDFDDFQLHRSHTKRNASHLLLGRQIAAAGHRASVALAILACLEPNKRLGWICRSNSLVKSGFMLDLRCCKVHLLHLI